MSDRDRLIQLIHEARTGVRIAKGNDRDCGKAADAILADGWVRLDAETLSNLSIVKHAMRSGSQIVNLADADLEALRLRLSVVTDKQFPPTDEWLRRALTVTFGGREQ